MIHHKLLAHGMVFAGLFCLLGLTTLVGCMNEEEEEGEDRDWRIQERHDEDLGDVDRDPAGDPPASKASIERGKEQFTSRGCIGCHTVNGHGGKVGPDLSDERLNNRSRQWLRTQIRDPKKNDPQTLMPAYDTLNDKQVTDLVNYLQSLSSKESGGQKSSTAGESKTESSFSMQAAGQRWSEVCGQCHNLRSPGEYSDAQWQVAVHHMRVRVPLTGEDQRVILKFLQASN